LELGRQDPVQRFDAREFALTALPLGEMRPQFVQLSFRSMPLHKSRVEAGVKRMVYASSNHVMGGYQNIAEPERITTDIPPRPGTQYVTDGQTRDSTPYGSAKLFGERLGKCFAEIHGLSVIAVRIGWVKPGDNQPVDVRWLGHDGSRMDGEWQADDVRTLGMHLDGRCADEPGDTLLLVFHGDTTYALVRSPKHSASYFGGPLEEKVTGKRFGPRQLHHIANLSKHQIAVLGPPRYVPEVPLIYGMCYSGCLLKYQFDHNDITVLDLDPPDSSEDWPYENYPIILPYAPLGLGESRKQSWAEFAAEFPNLPDQQPSELVAVVPPPMTLGVSLWGRSGDAEGVAVAFECDLSAKRVEAYNVCS
jgi:hypothetical protein